MVDVPKDCERCKVQLMIEYNRLLAWGDAVGLIDVPEGSHVAYCLGTNAIELCNIVSRIARLLEEFKELNNRWKSDLDSRQVENMSLREEHAKKMDLTKQVSSLAAAYEENEQKRKHVRAVQHLSEWMSRKADCTKDIITNPMRVRWVMIDREAFEALLEDLHNLTERIHELMDDYRVKTIHETTAKSFREMVIMRNDLKELKSMLEAVTSLMKVSSTDPHGEFTSNADNHETLRDLLRLKELKCASKEMLLHAIASARIDIDEYLKGVLAVPRYLGMRQFEQQFTLIAVAGASNSVPNRPRGVFSREGIDFQVWIEWRKAEKMSAGSVEDNQSVLRTATLAQMLSISRPRHLYTPTCIGYVDNRESPDRFGWIFQMPHGSHSETTLNTLHNMLGQNSHKPTLSQRIAIAWKLASSLSYLHTTDWIHKGVHSGNVLFPCDNKSIDTQQPVLSGFEYSRPQGGETTSRSPDPRWDIYRWPTVQKEAPKAGRSRKTYDIYSFGLLLLEIAHWQPLHSLLCLKRWPAPSAQDCRVRGWLLNEEPLPPFRGEKPLTDLLHIAGDKYWKATRRCLVAHGESGMAVDEDSNQSEASNSIRLQDAFTELVVGELKGVSI